MTSYDEIGYTGGARMSESTLVGVRLGLRGDGCPPGRRRGMVLRGIPP